MASNELVDKLTDTLKGLVISVSGGIPGYDHDKIKRMVEKWGAKFTTMNIDQCTHLVTTESSIKRNLRKIKMARENEGCQVVNMNWLLKSIEKNIPEDVQEYLLAVDKNEEFKNSKGKKREREASLGDEPSNSKKMKHEQQIIRKYLTNLVDKKYPEPSNNLAVWQDHEELIWDATLVKLHSSEYPLVKVLRIQLLHSYAPDSFHTWEYECQIGSSKESIWVGDFGGLKSAKLAFETNFKKLSGLAWKNRHDPPVSNRWIVLEMYQRESLILSSKMRTLPPSVEQVLKFIFTSGNMDDYARTLANAGCDLQLIYTLPGKRELQINNKLLIGVALLRKLSSLTQPRDKKELLKTYANLNLRTIALSDTPRDIRVEFESLDLLLKLYDAKKILGSVPESLTLSQSCQVLGLAKLHPVDSTTTEFKMLHEYLMLSSIPRHPTKFQRVINVFRLERPGEAERFAQWEMENQNLKRDRRLLWHGSWSGNFVGILTQGLRGDGIASIDGKSFYPGVYFADMSTKSAGYCRATQGEALMLLCEVELGSGAKHHIGQTTHKKWRDAGYIHPDFTGTLVPDVHAGKERDTPEAKASLYHSEYVASSPAQVRLRYLFHVEMAPSDGW